MWERGWETIGVLLGHLTSFTRSLALHWPMTPIHSATSQTPPPHTPQQDRQPAKASNLSFRRGPWDFVKRCSLEQGLSPTPQQSVSGDQSGETTGTVGAHFIFSGSSQLECCTWVDIVIVQPIFAKLCSCTTSSCNQRCGVDVGIGRCSPPQA